MRTRIWACVVVVVFVVPLFAAQAELGTITGTVIDTSGAVLPGVTVDASSPALIEKLRTVVSDGTGRFSIARLPAGEYTVVAMLAGFKTASTRVSLAAGHSEHVTLQMSVGTTAETITVTGAAPAPNRQVRRVSNEKPRPFDTEAYDDIEENPFHRVATDPRSTFAVDVDTASYANVRRFIAGDELPPPGAVRIEELVNYFRFDYPQPAGRDPFSITTELTSCPWNNQHRLALIGLQGRETRERASSPRNLVFLIDVSGSMNSPDKLPLVVTGMRMLTDILTDRDRVAIVVYAGESGLALPSTPGDQKMRIHQALASLAAGGSTNGAEGILLAYQVARQNFIEGGINRVVLATDGDFNIGVTNQGDLVRLIEKERDTGIFLSILGVGTGNLKDSTMEKLADKGNGNYSYLDSPREVRKVLVREAGATLETIAKDVKIQVEFNPREVAAYRLIGYENRLLENEDFNNDMKDAGDIGAGQSVTALYEIVPVGVKVDASDVDALKYQRDARPSRAASSGELLTLKVRYKTPSGWKSNLLTRALMNQPTEMTPNAGFASAVVEFGMLLQRSRNSGSGSFASVAERARRFRGPDEEGYREEFIALAGQAARLRATEDAELEAAR